MELWGRGGGICQFLIILRLVCQGGGVYEGGFMWLELSCGCYGGFSVDFSINFVAFYRGSHIVFWLGW